MKEREREIYGNNKEFFPNDSSEAILELTFWNKINKFDFN